MIKRMYICIDLKSFYASVECVERGLDPFRTNLVVADPSRGTGAICLAVSPALKALGVRNRCRIFEIPPGLRYITAMPRMKLYMQRSADIYGIYLKYVASEDIHIYSVDECFIDVTPYLGLYRKTAREMAQMLIDAVFKETGICAAAGVGTNLFLAKVALDITAKYSPEHIGYLDEEEFRRTIWHHTPITDIWNVGHGTAARLKRMGAVDLYDVTKIDEKLLFNEFGVNARYLIDHAHGTEPCTIADIHSYQRKSHSLSASQILFENYTYDNARIVMKEMVDTLVLELAEKQLVAGSVSLYVGFADEKIRPSGGSRRLDNPSGSLPVLLSEFEQIYNEIGYTYPTACSFPHSNASDRSPFPLIRRISISLNDLVSDEALQQSLFSSTVDIEREHNLQQAILSIKNRYGKNALIKGMSLFEKATATKRNRLVGGHNAE